MEDKSGWPADMTEKIEAMEGALLAQRVAIATRCAPCGPTCTCCRPGCANTNRRGKIMLVWWDSRAKGQPRFRVHVIPTCARATGADRATEAEVLVDDLAHAHAFSFDTYPDSGRRVKVGMLCPDCRDLYLEVHGTTEHELLGVME